MPPGKLKIGSTPHVEVIKKTTTNSRLVIDGKLLYIYNLTNIKKIYVNT